MNFYDWMMEKYLGEDTAEGDLAQDMQSDLGFPLFDDYEVIESHLWRKNACRECKEVARICWKRYKRATR
ncbi:MAG: hypothetical protein GX781_00865 [Clostridiales bacterium]|nr:hypothetical protein [Clostridiales bacterium]